MRRKINPANRVSLYWWRPSAYLQLIALLVAIGLLRLNVRKLDSVKLSIKRPRRKRELGRSRSQLWAARRSEKVSKRPGSKAESLLAIVTESSTQLVHTCSGKIVI